MYFRYVSKVKAKNFSSKCIIVFPRTLHRLLLSFRYGFQFYRLFQQISTSFTMYTTRHWKLAIKKTFYSNAFYIYNRPTLRWMFCIQSETLGYETKYNSLLFYCWHSFDVCMIAKITVLFICVHIQDKSTVFAVFMKMPPIGFSDFNTMLLFPGLRLVLWVHVALCSLYKRPLDERGET